LGEKQISYCPFSHAIVWCISGFVKGFVPMMLLRKRQVSAVHGIISKKIAFGFLIDVNLSHSVHVKLIKIALSG
jgi:hypothetical protein